MLTYMYVNIGHGPYSHEWENFVRTAAPETEWNHEQSSLDILDLILKEYNIDLSQYGLDADRDLTFIKELIDGKK